MATAPNCPWKKSSLHFFHLVDRWKRRGFPRSTGIASSDAALYPQPANQVWTWDITKLLGPAKWTYYYLYVIIDIYSRYVVGWMLAHRESEHLAERLIRETLVKEGIHRDQLTIHSDRGPAMRSQAVAQFLATLGVTRVPQQTARQR